jgi:NADH-quinone oxidoreductase subunit K
MSPLHLCLLLSSLLFCIGFAGAILRSNAILALIGVELMLNAGNINLIAFWRYGPAAPAMPGILFAIFSIAVAAAEAAVGLAIILTVYRQRGNINLKQIDSMKG